VRDHELFKKPIPIDLTKPLRLSTPNSFKEQVKSDKIEVHSMSKSDKTGFPGWCVYASTLDGQPDVEILCGGINEKEASAAAIFRQGHLMHYGFDLSPGEMNDTSRGLLINSVAYIARFTDDRALIRLPENFVLSRAMARAWLNRGPAFFQYFQERLSEGAKASSGATTAEEYKPWFDLHRGELRLDEKSQFVIDEDIQALKTKFDAPEFFETAALALGDKSKAAAARRAVARFAPEGPNGQADAAAWKKWIDENRPYLFFSDFGGYRWYVDGLAKRRGIPTAEFTGPKRADVKK